MFSCLKLSVPSRNLHGRRLLGTTANLKVGEFRQNAASGDWVCFTTERANRPNQMVLTEAKLKTSQLEVYRPGCPFCDVALTGDPLLVLPSSEGADWGVRVVKNKFPTVTTVSSSCGGDLDARFRSMLTDLRDSTVLNKFYPAIGNHEVVIETPYHNRILARDTVSRAELLTRAWVQRGLALREDESTRHVLFYKNQGSTGGASILHPHAQVVGLPVVPQHVRRLQEVAFYWYIEHGRCVYEQTLEEELSEEASSKPSRIITSNDHFVSMVPFAAPSPYCCWIVPLVEGAHFENISEVQIKSFASILHTTLKKLDITLNEPDFNVVVRSAPMEDRGAARAFNASTFFRWHAIITPRSGPGEYGGFEFSSGIFCNNHLPEDDARVLREAKI